MTVSASSSRRDLLVHDSLHQHSEFTSPSKLVTRDIISNIPPSNYELDTLQWGNRLSGPVPHITDDISINTRTSNDVEQRHASMSKDPPNAVNAIIYSASFPAKNKWRLMSAATVVFFMGLNDGATGAIIPSIEIRYHVGYGVVSLLFLTNAVGFISAAFVVETIDTRFGRAKTYATALISSAIGFAALTSAPPYPVVVLSFLFTGFGFGMFLGITNAFLCSLRNGTMIMGFMHGAYGIGGIISPLIATAIINDLGHEHWSDFYAIPLALAVIALVGLAWSFRGFEEDMGLDPDTALHRTISQATNTTAKANLLWNAIKNRTTILGAIFILFYQGAEVAISGWIITYLITHRQGNPSSVGNVTSGFWAGITLGRFVLTPLATHTFNVSITVPKSLASHKAASNNASSKTKRRWRMPQRPFVLVLVILSAIFQVLVWLLPSIVGPAIAQSVASLFLGPLYPLATGYFARLLPRKLQITSLSFIGAMGSSGGAIVPLITGLLAQALKNGIGTAVLHPVVLASLMIVGAAWIILPSDKEEVRRDE